MGRNRKLEITDVLVCGEYTIVTVKGKAEALKSGSKLRDEAGNCFEVISVAMTEHCKPSDIAKTTDIALVAGKFKKHDMLYLEISV